MTGRAESNRESRTGDSGENGIEPRPRPRVDEHIEFFLAKLSRRMHRPCDRHGEVSAPTARHELTDLGVLVAGDHYQVGVGESLPYIRENSRNQEHLSDGGGT